MNKVKEEVKYQENVDTFFKMFNPKMEELSVYELYALPENEEINGPLVFDLYHERLTKSIKAFGQAKPIIVFDEGGLTWIIDGVRIKYAAADAGFTHVSCLKLEVDKTRAVEIMQLLNTGQRKETYAIKARRLEILNRYAKQFIKENGIGESENSSGETRDYIAANLKMCPTYVSDFQAVCASPKKDELIARMDDRAERLSLKKAAALARNKSVKVAELKKSIPRGRKEEYACEECPRRKIFQDAVNNYGDMLDELAFRIEGKEACHD
jgi:hypothetical protein